MKVTHWLRTGRYRISLSEAEYGLLNSLLMHGLSDMTDERQIEALPEKEQKLLQSDRWQSMASPLRVDEEK